jgi:hypothetical protein
VVCALVLLGSLEADRVIVAQLEVDRVTLGSADGLNAALGVRLAAGEQENCGADNPALGQEDTPQAHAIGALEPAGQKLPIGHSIALTEDHGQNLPLGQGTGAPEEQKNEAGQGTQDS